MSVWASSAVVPFTGVMAINFVRARRPFAWVFALVLALLAGSANPAFASTNRTSITVDCTVGETYLDDHALVPGDTLIVTVVNCENWNITDLDHASEGNTNLPGGSIFITTNNNTSFEVTGAADIDFDPPRDGNNAVIGAIVDIDVDVYMATPATVPAGDLVDTQTLTMTRRDVDDFEVGQVADRGDYYNLGGDSDCRLEVGFHTYVTQSFTVTSPGDHTFRSISVSPTDEDVEWGKPRYPSDDFFLALYSSFDPDNPEANLIACNDDRPFESDDDWYRFATNNGESYVFDWRAPVMTASLASGTFEMVLTTHASASDTDWFNGEYSSWSRYGIAKYNWEWSCPQCVGGSSSDIQMTALIEVWNDASPDLAGESRAHSAAKSGSPGIYLWVPPGNNRIASGSNIYFGSDRVAAGSIYEVSLSPLGGWAKPIIVARGAIGPTGTFSRVIVLPDLEPGTHELVVRLTGPNRVELRLVNHLSITKAGRVESVSVEADQPRL